MKKNVNFMRFIKILCLVLCVAVLSSACLSLCFFYDYTGILMSGLYHEPQASIDVVLLGASEAYIDYSAAYAYDLYGYTSYPYAWDAATGELYEAQVREILKRQDPEWIVVEINGILYDDVADATNPHSQRLFLDNTPMSLNKLRTIFQYVPKGERYQYLFPLAKYHANWKTAYDQGGLIMDLLSIRKNGSMLKGMVTNVRPFDAPKIKDVADDYSTKPLEENSQKYLLSFLEFCKEEGLDNVLFVRFPHIIADEWNYNRFRRCNQAEQIIREYGYDFINLERNHQQIGLDFSQDFYNPDHLNYIGQQKLTACLGKILTEEYGVGKSDLTADEKAAWDKSAQYIHAFYDFCDNAMATGEYGVYYETRDLMEQLNVE